MADVSIDAAMSTSTARAGRSLVFVTADIGYQFFIDGDADFFYKKTTDGGATWGANVEIDTDTTITALAFDVWFDQWTPGDSGTKIHIAWIQIDVDDVLYRSLDTNGDTLGTQATIFAGATAAAGIGTFCSIAKMRGGNLYCAFNIDNGTELGLARSTDGGGTWGSRTSIVEAAPDWALLFPGNQADNQDLWALYFDASANSLTVKGHDDSANSTSFESSSLITIAENTTDLTGQYPFSGSIRHSDGRLIISGITAYDSAGASTHAVTSVGASGAVTALTAIATNIDDHYYPSVFIDQNTDDIYVAYTGKRDGSETLGTSAKVYYTKSTDGGSTWSAGDTAYMEGAADAVLQTWAPIMGPRFFIAWRRDSTVLEGNAVNSVTFSGLTHHTVTADPGSFTITGTAASLERGLKVAADAGSVALTGTAASLERGYEVAASAGNVAVTGTDATFDRTYIVAANAGSVAVTGTAASLERGLEVAADPGSVAITGTAASLERGLKVGADAGSVAIAGTDATFDRTYVATTQVGSVTIAGTAASLEVGYEVAADPGAVLITGTDATLTYTDAGDPVLTADPGSVALTGTAASLEKGSKVSADSGAVTVTGTAATLEADRKVTADAGSVAITGTSTSLERGLKVLADVGSYAITGTAAAFRIGYEVAAEVGSVTITGTDATLVYDTPDIVLTADPGEITITGVDVEFIHAIPARVIPGATRAQHRRFKQNAEVVLLGRPVVSGSGSLEVRISGTAEGYVKDVGGVKAVAEVFGVEAAAEIMLQQAGAARTAAGTMSFPKHAVVWLEGVAAGFEVGEATPQAGSSAPLSVRRRGVSRAGQMQPSATSNPTDREIALMALQLVRQRRQARNARRARR